MNWKTDLFHCPSADLCLVGAFCPCVLYGNNGAIMQSINQDPYPNCWIHSISYIIAGACGALTFSIGAISFIPLHHHHHIQLINILTSIGAHIGVGVLAGINRTNIRRKYGIQGSQYTDCIYHTLSSPCALCQETTELSNVDIIKSAPIYVPPVEQSMNF